MKVYYDLNSKSFINENNYMSDVINNLKTKNKRKYTVLVLDSNSASYKEYLQEKNKKFEPKKTCEQIAMVF